MGLIGGVQAPPGRVMGHAGAFVTPGEPDACTKIRALEDAGVVMTNHPAKFGEGMSRLLGSISPSKGTVSIEVSSQVDEVRGPNMITGRHPQGPTKDHSHNPSSSQTASLKIPGQFVLLPETNSLSKKITSSRYATRTKCFRVVQPRGCL